MVLVGFLTSPAQIGAELPPTLDLAYISYPEISEAAKARGTLKTDCAGWNQVWAAGERYPATIPASCPFYSPRHRPLRGAHDIRRDRKPRTRAGARLSRQEQTTCMIDCLIVHVHVVCSAALWHASD